MNKTSGHKFIYSFVLITFSIVSFFFCQVRAALIKDSTSSPVSSQWQQYIDKVNVNLQEGCSPQRRLLDLSSTNSTGTQQEKKAIKGAILIYHGFTACPDAMEGIAEKLADDGYLSWIPLNPGHGLIKGDTICKNDPKAQCFRDTPSGYLPTTKEEYIDFVTWSVEMMKEDLDLYYPQYKSDPAFVVGALGHSLGGALTHVAAGIAPKLFTHVVAVNAFWGLSFQGLDFNVGKCQSLENNKDRLHCAEKIVQSIFGDKEGLKKKSNPNRSYLVSSFLDTGKEALELLLFALKLTTWPIIGLPKTILRHKIKNSLLEDYDGLWLLIRQTILNISESKVWRYFFKGFMKSSFSWGESCFENTNRPGYCIFKYENLFAINSIGMYAMSSVDKLTKSSQSSLKKPTYRYISGERDGPQRNGITQSLFNTARSIGKADYCVFQVQSGTDLTNFNGNSEGMPHSCFSRIESEYIPPNGMYWKENLFQTIVTYFDSSFGDQDDVVNINTTMLDLTPHKDKCTTIPQSSVPESLQRLFSPHGDKTLKMAIRFYQKGVQKKSNCLGNRCISNP